MELTIHIPSSAMAAIELSDSNTEMAIFRILMSGAINGVFKIKKFYPMRTKIRTNNDFIFTEKIYFCENYSD